MCVRALGASIASYGCVFWAYAKPKLIQSHSAFFGLFLFYFFQTNKHRTIHFWEWTNKPKHRTSLIICYCRIYNVNSHKLNHKIQWVYYVMYILCQLINRFGKSIFIRISISSMKIIFGHAEWNIPHINIPSLDCVFFHWMWAIYLHTRKKNNNNNELFMINKW